MLGERKTSLVSCAWQGAIGWGDVGAFDRAGRDAWLALSFSQLCLIMVLGLVVILRLPISENQHQQARFWHGFRVLMARRRWILSLITWSSLAGLGAGILNNYLFSTPDQLGAKETLMGLAFDRRDSQRKLTVSRCLAGCAALGPDGSWQPPSVAMVIRMLAYSVVTTPHGRCW